MTRLDGLDPTYAAGRVIAKTAQGILLESDAGLRMVRIPPGTLVWKEFDVSPDAIAIGDWVDAKGAPLDDGSLVARSGWIFVNIGRRDGVVQSANGGGVVIRDARGVASILELSRRLTVLGPDGATLPRGVAALRPGMEIGAVGLVLPDGGFRATTIWTSQS